MPLEPGPTAISIAVLGLVSPVLCGCEDPPPPWARSQRREVVDESKPFLASSSRDGWLGPGGASHRGDVPPDELPDAGDGAKSLDGSTGKASGLGAESEVGGLWASCYRGFRTTNGPARDVTRLGLICGPVTGMTRLGKTVTGTINPSEPAVHKIEAVAGGCYRLFAVSAGIGDLGLQVATARGTEVARDQLQGAWAIVDPARPFCTFDAETFTVTVLSAAGDGSYALQVWQLPPSKSR